MKLENLTHIREDRFIGGIFQINSEKYSIKSICTFGHAGCSCDTSMVCSCYPNVAFAQLEVGVLVPSGCLLGFFGATC